MPPHQIAISRLLPILLLSGLAALSIAPGCMPTIAGNHPAFAGRSLPLIVGTTGVRCPRNAIACFEELLQQGADALQADLGILRNGTLVLFRDTNALAQTGTDLELARATLAQWQRLDAGHAFSPDAGATHPYRGQGLQVPKLEEFLRSFPGVPLLLDVDTAKPGIAAAVRTLAVGLSDADRSRLYFRTADPGLAADLRALSPPPFVALSAAEVEAARQAVAAGTAASLPAWAPTWIDVAGRPLTAAFAAWAAQHGHLVTAARTTGEDEWRALHEGGLVDGFVTERPDLVHAAFPKRALPALRRGEELACNALAADLRRLEITAAEGWNPFAADDLVELRHRFTEQCVRYNQIQVVGSHNSYHVESAPTINSWLMVNDIALWVGWGYTHTPLADQLGRLGVRQFELDVFLDPQGGRFANPGVNQLLGLPAPNVPELLEPGFKVIHVQDIDYRTTCPTLRRCLEDVHAWSAANPSHLPIAILLELKSDTPPPLAFPTVSGLPWAASDLDDLDALIREIFPPEMLLTPDDVRGPRPTLEEAVLTDGWPALGEVRGRTLFLLDNQGRERDLYLSGHPSLRGRAIFAPSSPGRPEAAFIKANDPFGRVEELRQRVREGYIIRTRADANTLEGRINGTLRREAALRTGAQFVSTDYEEEDPRFGSGYLVRMPGAPVARCNPGNAPALCRSSALAGAPTAP